MIDRPWNSLLLRLFALLAVSNAELWKLRVMGGWLAMVLGYILAVLVAIYGRYYTISSIKVLPFENPNPAICACWKDFYVVDSAEFFYIIFELLLRCAEW